MLPERKDNPRLTTSISGFTLVEIAIVMVIISLVFAGGLAGFKGFRDSALYSQTDTYLKESRIALLSLALSQGHLACPDTDGDGLPNVKDSAGTCTANAGGLPWQALGLGSQPPWDGAVIYAVNRQVVTDSCSAAGQSVCFFEDAQAPAFDLKTPPRADSSGEGNLQVADSGGAVIADNVIAVLISTGKNALQTAADCAAASADERENCDGDADFVMDVTRTNAADFFDDQLIWIHANTLKGQMRDAGIL